MKNWFSKLLEEMTEQQRSAFRVTLIILGAVLVSLPLYVYLALQSGTWQIYTILVSVTALLILLVYSVTLIRQNRVNLAMTLIIGSICVIMPEIAALISGLGVILGIALVLIVPLITGQTLTSTRITRAFLVAGIVFGILTVLIDLFAPWERVSYPLLQNAVPSIVVVALLALGIYFFGRQFRNFSLRAKLISAFLIVTLIPLAVITYLNYRSTTQALVDAANVKVTGAAQATADQVDSFITNTLNTTRVKAQDPAIVDYMLLPSFQRDGSPEEAQVYRLLTSYSREDPLYVNSIGVIDTRGRSWADTSPAEIGVDKSDRVYFQQPLETGLPYTSELIFSGVTGKPSIYFTSPIYNTSDGSVIGIFRIRYDAGILQGIVAKNTGLAGANSLPVLLDENHIRLAHGLLPELNYKTIIPLSPDALAALQANDRLPAGTAEELSTNLPGFEEGLNNIDEQPFFIAELHEEGEGSEQTTVVRLKSRSWTLVFGQDEDVFLEPIQVQTRNSVVIAILLSVIVAFFGLYVAQSLAAPVVRLTAVANRIATGDIQVQAKVEAEDEIGALARTFNAMTAQLRDFIVSLEERVSARTKDLATVAEVGTAISSILEVKSLLQEVVDLTKERFSLYHSHIYLLDEAGENLVLASGAGEPGRQMVAEGRSIPLNREQSLVARAAREKAGVTVNDVTAEPDFLANPLLPNTRSELAVPMIVGGNVLGVFDVQSDIVGRFTDSDINIQTTLAAQVATSIQNVRSFEQSKTQAEFETLVNAIGQKIQRATTMEDTLQTAIRELGNTLGATRVKATLSGRPNGGTTTSAN